MSIRFLNVFRPASLYTKLWMRLLGCVAALAAWAIPATSSAADLPFRPVRLLAPQPPLTKIPVKTVREARDLLNPSELVLGVTVGKASRAYPINMLTGPQREVLNDSVDGVAIAATW